MTEHDVERGGVLGELDGAEGLGEHPVVAHGDDVERHAHGDGQTKSPDAAEEARMRADELKMRGQEIYVEQKGRLESAIDASKQPSEQPSEGEDQPAEEASEA